jgi:uncharacterized membrane protein YhaH (DUF805 family)
LQALALFFSTRGRLAPWPFARAIIAIYLIAALSQLLISRPVLTNTGPIPFALVQGLAAWSWFCLHAKRLRDSGGEIGAAAGIAVLYALAVLLFILTAMVLADPVSKDATAAPSAEPADLLIWLRLLGMLASESDPGLFGYVVMAVLVLILLALGVAIAFSVLAFRRPSAAHAAAPSQ